ncbi:hypothetical protein GCM10020331_060050 [Ectobacillus funiculus]
MFVDLYICEQLQVLKNNIVKNVAKNRRNCLNIFFKKSCYDNLELTTDQKDAEIVETIIRIVNMFSDNNTVEDRIEAFVGQEGEQRIELNNGYLETDGKVIKLYLETYPFFKNTAKKA